MIPSEKREKLAKEWGLSETQIDALEKMNSADAEKAIQAGIESKEADSATPVAPVEEGKDVATAEAAPVVSETVAPAVVEPTAVAPQAYTLDQIGETIKASMASVLEPLNARLQDLEAQVKELKEPVETQVAKAAESTPMASLGALLAQAAQSAIGNPLARVDGRTELAKQKPAEAEAGSSGRQTFVPFINELVNPPASK